MEIPARTTVDKDKFLKSMEQTLGEPKNSISEDTRLIDLVTWESVGIVSVTLMIEEKYGLILEPHQLEPCQTAGDVITLIQSG